MNLQKKNWKWLLQQTHETWSDHEVWIQEKEDQVQLLLKRAEGLSVEKSDPKESIVYDAMAKDLTEVRMQSSSD